MIGVVVVLVLAHSVSSIPIGDFLPFNGPNVCLFDTVTMLVHKNNVIGSDGVSIDDITRRDCEEFRLGPNNDGSSHNMSIGFTFPFFARSFKNLYVNTNGVISFIEPVPQFNPDPFPIKDRYLISPYWADVDIRGIGDVFFKETTDASLLTQANDIMQSATVQTSGLSSFKPRWMLIVTWYNVGYFSSHTDMTNTFQALLVTDGKHSFVVFNYLDDGISWTRGDASRVDAQVGFNFGGDPLSFNVFNTSSTSAIVDIEEMSNTGSPGQYVYRVDSAVIRNITTTASGCDELPILVDPIDPTIINGGVMTLTGPSFNTTSSHEKITCVFTDDDGDVTEGFPRDFTRPIQGIIVNCKAICPIPLFRKLGNHNLTITLNYKIYVAAFEVVPAIYKKPDVHIFDGDEELEFAIVYNDVNYSAIWNYEHLNKDQFKENGTIDITLENWFFIQFRTSKRWIKRRSMVLQGRAEPPFQLIDQDYSNGYVTFKQIINKPARFQFDISLVVLLKKTRSLNILYTSTILSFVAKEFSSSSAILRYCQLWLAENNEVVQCDNLQSCPCTLTSVRLDPDFITDPTCSSPCSTCHENVKTENVEASHCFLKSVNKAIHLGQQCCYKDDGNYITTNKPAGSADYYFPATHYLEHQSSDYFPYKVCCIDSNDNSLCEKYYQMRPKDNGDNCGTAEPDSGVCDHLVPPDNGDIDCSLGDDGAANIRDTCTFTCDDGFKLHGSAMRECQFQHSENTSWSGNEARCEPVGRICPTLMAPENGMINCSLGDDGVPTNGDSCTFTCDDGFMLQGGTMRQCQTNRRMRNWNGDEAHCVQVPGRVCPPLIAPENGVIHCSLGDDGVATNGDTCIVTCDNKFTLSGDATRTCRIKRRKMNWSGDEARCVEAVTVPSSCKPLSAPDNGMIDCSLGDDGVPTNGDMCTFTCNDGFNLSGSRTSRCRIRNNRGKWSRNQATCNSIMGCVDIKSITVQTTTRGKTATVTFSSHPDATFTCQLDSGTAVACTSPQKFSRLSRGSHSITVVSTCPGETKGISHTSTFRIPRA